MSETLGARGAEACPGCAPVSVPTSAPGGPAAQAQGHKAATALAGLAGQIAALLDAAGELDRESRTDRQHINRRAQLATLVFAGLRISELLASGWADVDLAAGWLTVGESKTDAGRRKVKIRPVLRDVLAELRPKQTPDRMRSFSAPRPGRLRTRPTSARG